MNIQKKAIKLFAIVLIIGTASFADGQTIPSEFDSCKHLGAFIGLHPQSEADFQMQFDTLKHYVESCTTSMSHFAFTCMDGDVQQTNTKDLYRFERYRNWLLSVVYLNTTDPYYFCACVESIAHSFIDSGKYYNANPILAVLRFEVTDSLCNTNSLIKEMKRDSGIRHARWLMGDTTKPEDTTLPSLEQLGLGALLNHQAVAPSNGQLPSQYLASFTSSPNPFVNETTLQFTLNRMTYTTVAVYDELGRLVWGDDGGASLEAGEHTIHLDGKNLPSGTLYARISTGFGEVKTVKLVHE
jgi:hypothetical protein